nr:putative F-box protein At1g49610 [Quercus suber]
MEEESHGSNYGETETSSSASTSSEDSILNSSDHSTHASRPAERITIYEEKEEEGEDSDCYVVCCKRRKHAPPISQDRISALPNSILLNILSSLPTKDAIKTGVLSKRWSYVWTSVPSLSFSDDYEDTDRFATAVDNTLLLHKAPKLTKFYLRFNYRPDLKPRLDLWVRLATNAMVEQLSLRLTYAHVFNFETYLLPQHLYTNAFVSELDFSFCNIKPIGVVHLSSLKRLCIGYTALCGDDIRKVVMGSPRLEYLELNNCCRLNRLDIVSESLKKLVINNHYMLTAAGKIDDPVFELEIVAPKIESLEILGTFCMKKCRIKDVSSLVKAKLDFSMAVLKVEEESACNEYQEAVRELLESLHHVKELFVGKWCLMVLSLMSVKHVPSPLLKCKYVTVKTSMKKWDLPGIASLLQSLPYVETLVIDISHHNLGFKVCFSWRSKVT